MWWEAFYSNVHLEVKIGVKENGLWKEFFHKVEPSWLRNGGHCYKTWQTNGTEWP
jgi:hypothetical protein